MGTYGYAFIDCLSTCKRLTIRTVQIGEWDMDANATKSVAYGVELSKIRCLFVTIYNDARTAMYPIIGHDGAAACATIESVDATNVNMVRAPGGDFDNNDFDSTEINRGWITIFHVQ